jgi:prepilin-type N-terminal cleavage/methylation domain-containing protein
VPRPRHSGTAGFTLVELMVVMMIMGILVFIGMPVFSEGQMGARRNSCLDRQHLVFEAALLYCSDHVLGDSVMAANALEPTYLQAPAVYCPSDADHLTDDYDIVIVNGAPVDVVCNIGGTEHPWDP